MVKLFDITFANRKKKFVSYETNQTFHKALKLRKFLLNRKLLKACIQNSIMRYFCELTFVKKSTFLKQAVFFFELQKRK